MGTTQTEEQSTPAVKLTKTALNKFIQWTTTRYNDWGGYGSKSQNVERVLLSLKAGHDVGWGGRHPDPTKTVFTVECVAGEGVGYNAHGYGTRHWSTKQRGEKYTVDCVNRTITAQGREETIQFIKE